MNIRSLHSRRLLLTAGAIAATLGSAVHRFRLGCKRRLPQAAPRNSNRRSGQTWSLSATTTPRHSAPVTIRDAVTIFASGAVRTGIDAIMAALAPHFANREALWAWTEIYRVVDGCKSAFILYDATYDIPSIGYHQRTLTGVTYTHDGNKWLAIADQGTYLEAPGP